MERPDDTRAGRLAAALDDFIRSSPDVEAAAIVSFDGLPMATALPDGWEEDRVGAMSAALLSLGEQAALGLGRGQLNQVFVEGEHGFVFLMSAEDQAVLAAVASRDAKIGFMLYEMRRAAQRVGNVLAAPSVPPPPAVDPTESVPPAAVDPAEATRTRPLDLVRGTETRPDDDAGLFDAVQAEHALDGRTQQARIDRPERSVGDRAGQGLIDRVDHTADRADRADHADRAHHAVAGHAVPPGGAAQPG